MVVFQEYDGNLRTSDYIFNKGCFWVRVYDLPLDLMSMDVAERIGNKIGILKKIYHNPAKRGWGRNLHLRVEVDITKPLKTKTELQLLLPKALKYIFFSFSFF
ncbi:hypothetical protein PTKIN_Ptkin02bG0068900 [Pterospermum kingtungense]